MTQRLTSALEAHTLANPKARDELPSPLGGGGPLTMPSVEIQAPFGLILLDIVGIFGLCAPRGDVRAAFKAGSDTALDWAAGCTSTASCWWQTPGESEQSILQQALLASQLNLHCRFNVSPPTLYADKSLADADKFNAVQRSVQVRQPDSASESAERLS